MNARFLIIIFVVSCAYVGQVAALEPSNSEGVMRQMLGKVGRGEAIFPLASTTDGKKRYDPGPGAVPISAIGNSRTASPSR
ncbi:MAG: hypothetical protein P8182_03415, partial [Deltaproteobacteria bacterium]